MKNKKSTLLYSILIIVFIICGILYINHQEQPSETFVSEVEPMESNEIIPMKEINSTLELEQKEEVDQVTTVNKRPTDEIEKTQEIEKVEETFCTVYICGAVNNPNVYTLSGGSRIKDVIDMAGGALPDANLNILNLAEKIVDSQKIYVPKIGEEIDKSLLKGENRDIGNNVNKTNVPNEPKQNDNGLININTASAEQLKTLPGIGDAISQNIIDYREEQGGFKSIDEIKNVSRIGEKTFEKIKDKITVN